MIYSNLVVIHPDMEVKYLMPELEWAGLNKIKYRYRSNSNLCNPRENLTVLAVL